METKQIWEKFRKGALETKNEVKKSTLLECFTEIVNQDELRVGYVICNICEALYVSVNS